MCIRDRRNAERRQRGANGIDHQLLLARVLVVLQGQRAPFSGCRHGSQPRRPGKRVGLDHAAPKRDQALGRRTQEELAALADPENGALRMAIGKRGQQWRQGNRAIAVKANAARQNQLGEATASNLGQRCLLYTSRCV